MLVFMGIDARCSASGRISAGFGGYCDLNVSKACLIDDAVTQMLMFVFCRCLMIWPHASSYSKSRNEEAIIPTTSGLSS